MNPPVPVDRDTILRRARSVIGEGKYALGAGGRVPSNSTPFDHEGYCDCTGFASWCLGIDRFQPDHIGGGWIETSHIVSDAKEAQKLFEVTTDPKPGDLIVYGDHNGHQGHIGVISDVANGRVLRVVHCSMGNFRIHGAAVGVSDPHLFELQKAITVRFKGMVSDVLPAA